ncbi:hypothetical protein SLEP1_g8974 [Rubroshorea leprosula]|uniref:Uncharacterized protein n=1 Tax=Rubroshorea leprosula TaxID=152421 RepID=A0AAV5IBU6_9ROSI|nr:hypothetical protein SLEP1_g8974 [Rubroshorea leprosula]
MPLQLLAIQLQQYLTDQLKANRKVLFAGEIVLREKAIIVKAA